MPPGYQGYDVIASPGDVVFIHGFLAHESYANVSDGYRRVLLATYVREGAVSAWAQRTA